MKCNYNGCSSKCKGDIDAESCNVLRAYQQGAKEFAEWLPTHFDLRFSNNPDVWLDEFFNHTRDKVLAEWRKGAENE